MTPQTCVMPVWQSVFVLGTGVVVVVVVVGLGIISSKKNLIKESTLFIH